VTEGDAAPQTRAARRRTRRSDAASEPRRHVRWIRAAGDRVPTKWFAGLATALLLASTAAFGGLATAAEPGPAALQPGDEHRNEQFAIRVLDARLRGEEPDAGIYLDDGERMLTVRAQVENVWTQPQSSSNLTQNLTVDDLPVPDSVRRVDDTTFVTRLQPNVPTEVELRWILEEGDLADGDVLRLTFRDLSQHVGSFVMDGTWWTDPVPAATMALVVDDASGATP